MADFLYLKFKDHDLHVRISVFIQPDLQILRFKCTNQASVLVIQQKKKVCVWESTLRVTFHGDLNKQVSTSNLYISFT